MKLSSKSKGSLTNKSDKSQMNDLNLAYTSAPP